MQVLDKYGRVKVALTTSATEITVGSTAVLGGTSGLFLYNNAGVLGEATISTGLTVGTTPITSGTIGRVLFQGTGNVLQQSSSLFWDNPNSRLGIGTSTPATSISILQQIGSQAIIQLQTLDNSFANGYTGFNCFDNSGSLAFSFAYGNPSSALPNAGIIGPRTANGRLSFVTGASAVNQITMFPTGNLLLQNGGTHTDAGFKLDVNGTARVQGLTTLAGTILASSGFGRNAIINGSITATANNDILTGIQLAPTYSASTFTGVNYFGLIIGSTSGRSLRFQRDTITVGPFQRNNINAYNGSGSDSLFIQDAHNGAVYIGNGGGEVQLNGSGKVYTGSGNLLLNTTTDAGFRLDVNGTARVQGQTTLRGAGTTSSTTALLVTNNTPTDLFKITDDGAVTSSGNITFTNDFRSIGTSGQTLRFSNTGSETRMGVSGIGTSGRFFIWSAGSNLIRNLTHSNGQSFINTTSSDITVNASAAFQIESTTLGFLPPRMTTTQKNAIASPAAGLMVYDTTLNVISYYNGTSWI